MLRKLPKIELHCHLDGSVRLNTIIEVAKQENIELPSFEVETLDSLIKVPEDCTSLEEYLKRFDLPNKIMQSKSSLKRIAFELLEDCSRENVKYIEIRFAPSLHRQKGLSLEEIIESVLEGMHEAEKIYDIKSNLIIGCMRSMSVEEAFSVVNAGKKYLNRGVVAVDLCGIELEGFASIYKEPIDLARSLGYRVTIHAGEGASGKNVLDAINLLGAERIGHGIRTKDINEAYDLAKAKKIVFEMCPTSNVQTKAIDNFSKHPFYNFYKDDMLVTISTDNRTVSDIDLTNELNIIFDEFNMGIEEYSKIYLNTVDACFADSNTKDWLRSLI